MWLTYHQRGSSSDCGVRLQGAMWDRETAHNAGFGVDQWDCSPYAVASAAHHWMPDVGFDHFQSDDPLSGSVYQVRVDLGVRIDRLRSA
jgi:hypothetical protein